MLRIVIKSLRRQLTRVKHPHVQKNAQEQYEQQVQPMEYEPVNATNTIAP